MKSTVGIDIDTTRLSGYTDEYLAMLWYVAQANPGYGAPENSDLVKAIGDEITRRWLVSIPPTLYNHQSTDFYRKLLMDNGTFSNEGRDWTPHNSGGK